jgi:hypothetical protein
MKLAPSSNGPGEADASEAAPAGAVVFAVGAPSVIKHSASHASKWLRAMGMEAGDILVEECQEIDGCLVRTATRIERDGVVMRRTEEEPSLTVQRPNARFAVVQPLSDDWADRVNFLRIGELKIRHRSNLQHRGKPATLAF